MKVAQCEEVICATWRCGSHDTRLYVCRVVVCNESCGKII